VGLIGDFAVAVVVAHEYAHNIQAELGIFGGGFATYKTELQADCWAGIWANSAYAKGILDPGDLEEGLELARQIGDYDSRDEGHHGTPEQREAAFSSGYESGNPITCNQWLDFQNS
jgi:predicted metalloprotease